MTAVDRTALPGVGDPVPFPFPPIEAETLPNGVRLWTVDRPDPDLVTVLLCLRHGSAADPPGREGLAALTGDLLDEGTRERSGIALHEAVQRIGGGLGIQVGSDATVVSITALARFAREALGLVVEVAARPRFDPADVERVRGLRLNRLAQSRRVPAAVADRAFLAALYGGHPYGHPSIGAAPALEAVGVDDVAGFHARHFGCGGWTVIAAGGEPARLRALAAEALAGLPADGAAAGGASGASGPSGGSDGEPPAAGPAEGGGGGGGPSAAPIPAAPVAPAPPLAPPRAPRRLVLVPHPGAAQSEIRLGHVGAARNTPDYPALLVLNMVLGGQFVSRLNLNLRESKGYTYGARSAFDLRRGPGPFVLRTAVRTSATADALREAAAEVAAIRGARPVTADELAGARAALTRGFARRFETAAQVALAALRVALYDLPADEDTTFVSRVAAVDAAAVAAAAERQLRPEHLVAVVVGAPEPLRAALGEAGFGDPVEG